MVTMNIAINQAITTPSKILLKIEKVLLTDRNVLR